MEVIIDIPEDHKRVIDNLVEDGKGYLLPYEVENKMALAIRNGKVLSDMTNGDVIMAMFPNAKTWEVTRDDVHCAYIEFKDICEIKSFPLSWWNAPYKKENKE